MIAPPFRVIKPRSHIAHVSKSSGAWRKTIPRFPQERRKHSPVLKSWRIYSTTCTPLPSVVHRTSGLTGSELDSLCRFSGSVFKGFDASELDSLRRFYESVETTTQELIATTTRDQKLNCKRGCGGCCIDGLSVSPLEAAYIFTLADRKKIREPISGSAAQVVLVDLDLDAMVREGGGRCAFLAEDNSCTIYEQRPYVCRHFGLPLRWDSGESDRNAGEVHEARDICPLNEDCLDAPIEQLPAEQCFPVDEVWETLDTLQASSNEGEEEQGMALRDLHQAIIADTTR